MQILVVTVALLAGCMPKYTYERAPLPRATASAAARCYQAKRFALAAGHGTWIKQYRTPGLFADTVTTETWGADGIAIYRGDRRLEPAAALPALVDHDLARAYADDHAGTASAAAWYPRWRNLSLGLAFTGLAMAGGALGLVLDNPEDGRVDPLLYSSVGVALLSIIPAILAAKTYDDAVRHHLQGEMFTRREWGGRLADAVETTNVRIADECQYDQADVPISQHAQSLIGGTE